MNEQHLVELLESLNCEFLKFEESTYYFIDKETDLILTFPKNAKQNQVIASVLEKRDEFEVFKKVGVLENGKLKKLRRFG